jgi:hypothetical protein
MKLLKNIQGLLAEMADKNDSAAALNAWAELTDWIEKIERVKSPVTLANWIFQLADELMDGGGR